MRATVYIAGPITKGDLCHNVNQATAAFIALATAGFAPMCPHWSVYSKPAAESESPWGGTTGRVWCEATAAGNDVMAYADWLGIGLAWVKRSDALLRLPGESTGADMETACAREHGVPVFDSLEALTAHFERARGAA